MLYTPDHPSQRVTVTAATAIARGQLVDAATGQLATEFSPTIGVALSDAAAGEAIALATSGEASAKISDGFRYSGVSAAEYARDSTSTDLYLAVGTDSAASNAGTTSTSAFAYGVADTWAAPEGEGVAEQFVHVVLL